MNLYQTCKHLEKTGKGLKNKKATPGFEPGVRALQAPALPLGHVALNQL